MRFLHVDNRQHEAAHVATTALCCVVAGVGTASVILMYLVPGKVLWDTHLAEWCSSRPVNALPRLDKTTSIALSSFPMTYVQALL